MTPDTDQRDKALMWLNDHIGQQVSVALKYDLSPEYSATLLSAEGELRHWVTADVASVVTDDLDGLAGLAGWYMIGNADVSLNLSQIDGLIPLFRHINDDGRVELEVSDGGTDIEVDVNDNDEPVFHPYVVEPADGLEITIGDGVHLSIVHGSRSLPGERDR